LFNQPFYNFPNTMVGYFLDADRAVVI